MLQFLHEPSKAMTERRSFSRGPPVARAARATQTPGALSKDQNQHGEKQEMGENQSCHFRQIHFSLLR
jgi:hypothetical protein